MSVSTGTLARSSLHVQALQAWQMASRLVLTPIVIASLGLDGYGVWVLLSSLCAYASALNSGVIWACVRWIAELDGRGERPRLSEAASSSAAVGAALTATALGVLWLLHGRALPWLGVPEPLLAEAAVTLAILSAAVLTEATVGYRVHVLAGLQRMDLQYRLLALGAMVELAVSVALLLTGHGIASLALGLLAGQIVASALAWVLCRRHCPSLRLSPRHVGTAGLRYLMPLAARFTSAAVLPTAARESIRLALSSLFGAAALGIYQLADRLLFVAGAPAMALVTPLMPAFTHLDSAGEVASWHRLYRRASKAIALAASLPLLFAAVFADDILFAWTGRHYPEAVWTARILAPAELAVLLTAVGVAGLRAAGSVGLELRYGLLGSLLALLGIVAATPWAGYGGGIVAVASGRGAAAAWFLARLRGRAGRFGPAQAPVLSSCLAAVPAVLAVLGLAVWLGVPRADAGRWSVLLTVAALASISGVLCAATAWLVILSAEERASLRRRARAALVVGGDNLERLR